MKIQEYAKATAAMLGERIDGLNEQLAQEHAKRENLQTTVAESDIAMEALNKAIEEKEELVQNLQDALKEAQQDQDAVERVRRLADYTLPSGVRLADIVGSVNLQPPPSGTIQAEIVGTFYKPPDPDDPGKEGKSA